MQLVYIPRRHNYMMYLYRMTQHDERLLTLCISHHDTSYTVSCYFSLLCDWYSTTDTSLRYSLMHYYSLLLHDTEKNVALDYAHASFEDTPATSSHPFAISICVGCLFPHVFGSKGSPFESKLRLRFLRAPAFPACFHCCRQSACL